MKTSLVLFVMIVLVALQSSYAQIPRTLSYQAVLTDNAGVPKPDGSYLITFRIYAAASGGAALWTESQTLQVKRGLFSAVLGSVTPLGANLTFTQPYWLSLHVPPDPEMTPRLPLTSVGYSFNAMKADSARYAQGTVAPAPLALSATVSSPNYVFSSTATGTGGGVQGNSVSGRGVAGISSTWQGVYGLSNSNAGVVGESPLFHGIYGVSHSVNSGGVFGTNDANGFGVAGICNGGVGVQGNSTSGRGVAGISSTWQGVFGYSNANAGVVGESPLFHGIYGVSHSVNSGGVYGTNDANGFGVAGISAGGVGVQGNSTSGRGVAGISSTWQGVFGYSNSNAGVVGESPLFHGVYGVSHSVNNAGVYGTNDAGGWAGIFTGKVAVNVLQINGGSDLAEPFETESDEVVEPGSIMVIDPINPGKLKLSELPYDARVAGIVSGAGNIKPGITLQQDGITQGRTLVAIAGRVYCKADAHSGTIEPGDLLTTSNIPGHAMKATERDRSHGAIIGKAMSSLKAGTGLVLVLVNLQ
jgi:hypothetical protein